MAADQAKVAQLTAEDARASGSKKDELDDRLNLAKARLELDQDEVDDGKEDLGRAALRRPHDSTPGWPTLGPSPQWAKHRDFTH